MRFSLKKFLQSQRLILFIFCSLALFYIVLRAYNVPFTFDEITTSQIVEGDNWTDFGSSANNHLLNTLLMKGVLMLFDSSVFVYRIPNVLAFILFLIYSFKLGVFLTPSKPYLTAIVLISMPFLLDFFGLARGYGLSISFLTVSVYYLLRYSDQLKVYYLLASLFFGVCAVLSNFTLLHFFLPLLFLLFVFIFKTKTKAKIIQNLVLFIIIVVVFFILVTPILFQLRDGQHLIFGGRDSFYSSVVLSIGRCLGYGVINTKISEIIFTLLFALALCFSVVQIFKVIRNRVITVKEVLPILFILTILSPISQHILFGTFYPAERTALLYYPLMVLVLVQGLGIYFFSLREITLKIFSFALITLLIFTLNSSHTYSWRYESGTQNMLKYLKTVSKTTKKSISLGMDYIYTPPAWYYKHQLNFTKLETHEVIGCCWEFDMEIEELNPIYYGAGQYSKKHMSLEDLNKVFSNNFDYYYLNGYTVRELRRNKIPFNLVLSDNNSDACLIKFE